MIQIRMKKECFDDLKIDMCFSTLRETIEMHSLSSPFNDVVTVVLFLVGSGGATLLLQELSKIIQKHIEGKKSNYSIKSNYKGEIEINCTNSSKEEVLELYKIIKEYNEALKSES